MTSRRRILAALNHEPVDRCPIDLGGTRQSGISAFAYAPLRRHLAGLVDAGSPFRVFDLCQMLAEIEPAVAARFGSDCVLLNRPAAPFGYGWGDWKPYEFDGIGRVLVPAGFDPHREPSGDLILTRDGQVIARMPTGGFYFDRTDKSPGATHPDLDAWRPPRLTDADFAYYAAEARRLHETTDKAVVTAFGPPYELFNGIGQGGFEDWVCTFATEDDYVHRLYGMLVDIWIDNLEKLHRAVGDHVQVIQIADDFGTQAAPFLSERMFRDKVLPAYRRGTDWIHRHTNWKVLLHSDGALYPLLPAIVEMGVDALNPVQMTAAGMDPRRLKAEFGRELTFWGGACDSQGTLATGTPRAVADEVRRNLEVFLPGSGYVFAPVHNVQALVPPENVVAMFDAALQATPHPGQPAGQRYPG